MENDVTQQETSYFRYDLLGPNKILAEGPGEISLCCGVYNKRF